MSEQCATCGATEMLVDRRNEDDTLTILCFPCAETEWRDAQLVTEGL